VTTKFNDSLTMLAHLPVGTKFRKMNGKTTFVKVSPWHVRRIGSPKVSSRTPTTTMVYAETPSWSL
jgi:hypothetical protein